MSSEMQHFFTGKFLLVMSGLWRLRLDWLGDNKYFLYKIYSVFMRIYYTIFVIALYVGTIAMWKINVNSAIEATGVLVFCTIVLCKAFLCQKRSVTQMIAYILDYEKEFNTLDEDSSTIYKSFSIYNKYLNIILFMYSTMCGITLIVTKFIVYEQQIKRAARNHDISITEKPLPYVMWRPVNEKEHYNIAFTLDIWSACVGCTFNTATQSVYISLFTYIIGQLKILQNKFRKFGLQQETLPKQFENLRNLILEHKKIISFVEELDDNLRHMLLLEFSVNSFQITTVIYQLLTSKADVIIIFRICWLSCMVLQVFVLAWHANEIQLESMNISQAIYESIWYEIPENLKKCLAFIMLRSQNPLKITVGPFFILTNSTALTTVKAAYSYLAVLNNSRHNRN